jgi:hypothetical protein
MLLHFRRNFSISHFKASLSRFKASVSFLASLACDVHCSLICSHVALAAFNFFPVTQLPYSGIDNFLLHV